MHYLEFSFRVYETRPDALLFLCLRDAERRARQLGDNLFIEKTRLSATRDALRRSPFRVVFPLRRSSFLDAENERLGYAWPGLYSMLEL